jgi:hypothetical protein
MRVLLRRKLADHIDGVDLSGHNVGDVFDLPWSDARLLIAEQWAVPERRLLAREEGPRQYLTQVSETPQSDARGVSTVDRSGQPRALAADTAPSRKHRRDAGANPPASRSHKRR